MWDIVGCLFFPFAPLRAFDFDQKLSRNVVQIILYYYVTNQFLPCLIWLVTCFWFQNMFWKNINCFRFWWKTYPKCCTSSYVISRIKSFLHPHFAVGQVLSISGYNLENGTWRWKSRFWFCSSFAYFADLKTIYFASCFCCICKLL